MKKSKQIFDANLSTEELEDLANNIHIILLGDRGATLSQYKEIAKNISQKKMGHRCFKAFQHEPRIEAYFPLEIYDILRARANKQKVAFTELDTIFIKNNIGRGMVWLAKRLYCKEKMLKRYVKALRIPIRQKNK